MKKVIQLTNKTIKRLPPVKPLSEILPKGTEGGKEFARIVDLLLFHEARRIGKKATIFSDASGDYNGLDSFEGDVFRKEGTIGYQYKFYSSSLSSEHRNSIIKSLKRVAENWEKLKLKKWILITPEDFIESSTRKDGGDVTWFENLRNELGLKFELEHWGHQNLLNLFLQTPHLCLFYYPELVEDGVNRKRTIEDTRKRYNDNIQKLYREVQFVGMSIYKQEATKGIPMEHIYIPLAVIPEAAEEKSSEVQRINPLSLLVPGSNCIILGDPGSGKSTMMRFLSLTGISKSLQERYKANPDNRLPIYIILRFYADELKSRPNLSLIDYIQENIQGYFSLKSADLNFFEYYLESGQTILLFDGLDEMPNPHFKQIVRDRIIGLITTYPGNSAIITSRIIGYDNPFRFDSNEFKHFRLTKLQFPEIEQFIRDWYRIRIENIKEREANIQDLIRILQDENGQPIRELAENPLLLTIITLVHRIDAVLPDERVVLYQKCTETLLNTWHQWKYRETEGKNRGKTERRNQRRIEAIAYWMHCRSISTAETQRAVVPYSDLCAFLTKHIESEKPVDPESDPEDLAKEFLEFIKKRAGLLIEIGDEQYSFVHLTFQEYLASSYIKVTNEQNGGEGIWETIKDYRNDARWHEVIRLLIAGLDSYKCQHFLIERISRNSSQQQIVTTLLLGGLLLDGIEATAEFQNEIIEQLVIAAYNVKEIEQLRPIMSILTTWLAKDAKNIDIIALIINKLKNGINDETQKTALALIAISLNLTKDKQIELVRELHFSDQRIVDLFHLFYREIFDECNYTSLQKDFEFLFNIKNYFAYKSFYPNFVAVVLNSINQSIEKINEIKMIFEQQLIYILSIGNGPYYFFILNNLLIDTKNKLNIQDKTMGQGTALIKSQKRFTERPLAQAMNMVLDLNMNMALKRESIGKSTFERIRKLIQKRAQARNLDLDFDINHSLDHDHVLDRIIVQSKITNKSFWEQILAESDLVNPILDILCNIFALAPRAQWWWALRLHFLPSVPQRIKVFDESIWEQTKTNFEIEEPDEVDIYNAAWQLMYDAWLYIFNYYQTPDESIFKKLAELTRNNEAPPLQIAHCIRDLAYGDETRTNDLIAMANSDDPGYRSIFEDCFWRPTAEEELAIKNKENPERKKQNKTKDQN
jgi:hypothetical protein